MKSPREKLIYSRPCNASTGYHGLKIYESERLPDWDKFIDSLKTKKAAKDKHAIIKNGQHGVD